MKRFTFLHTVRGRLLLLAIGVEVVMLSVMVVNSLRLQHEAMTLQARRQVAQMAPVMNAAITAPMAQKDYATVQAILDESRKTAGINYIVVTDRGGQQVATSGWKVGDPLPAQSTLLKLFNEKKKPDFHIAVEITQSGQPLGELHFGLDLTNIVVARTTLLSQGIMIAALEITLSSILLFLLTLWLTRDLTFLTHASREVASGNLSPPPYPKGMMISVSWGSRSTPCQRQYPNESLI